MINGYWEPRSEEEWQLMEDLHTVTRHAHNEGVSRERIGALLAFMGSAAIDPQGDTESERSQSKPNTETLAEKLEEEEVLCPNCDTPIDTYITGMGLTPFEVEPCGCELREELEKSHFFAWWNEYESEL